MTVAFPFMMRLDEHAGLKGFTLLRDGKVELVQGPCPADQLPAALGVAIRFSIRRQRTRPAREATAQFMKAKVQADIANFLTPSGGAGTPLSGEDRWPASPMPETAE